MDHQPRPWRRTLFLPALAVVIALVAAASAWAAGSDPTDTNSPPAQYQPVQQDESAPPEGSRPDRDDCPEGARGDDDGSSSTAPDATATPNV